MNVLIVGLSENNIMRGVERYTLELIRNMLENKEISKITLLCGEWQSYFFNIDHLKLDIHILSVSNKKITRHLFHYFALPFYFKRHDVVHITNTNPLLFKFGKKVCITIHDLGEFFVPEKYSFFQGVYRKWVSWLVSKTATHIITDSQFSKNSIIKTLNVKEERVTAIYLGIEHFRKLRSDTVKSDCKNIFYLYWGVLERSKGVVETIKGFKEFVLNNPSSNAKLIICGKMGNAKQEILKLTEIDESIELLGHVSDEQLMGFIKNATAILFPSKYEGFGFPALEGFVYNNNIIASNTTSVGEITKSFAWQVSPSKIDEITNAMELALITPLKFSKDEKNRILDGFSWKICSEQTLSVYKSILRRR